MLRLGVLSTARINRSLFRAARELPDILAVTCVASRDPARAEQYAARHGIPSWQASYEELLEGPVDAIYVPLPAAMHGEWSIRALEAGKHVLCEKPFASNEQEARAMVEAADSRGLILMEAMHYWYHPLAARLYELAHEQLGPLTSVDARFQWPVPDLTDIRGIYELGGGATMDMGCYAVHWLRKSVDQEPTVLAARAQVSEDPRVDIRLEAELTFPSGVSGHYLASMEDGVEPKSAIEVVGRNGSVRADPFINPDRIVLEQNGSAQEITMDGTHTSFWYQLRAFATAIDDGVAPPTAGEDSVATMRVIDQLYRGAGLPLRMPAGSFQRRAQMPS